MLQLMQFLEEFAFLRLPVKVPVDAPTASAHHSQSHAEHAEERPSQGVVVGDVVRIDVQAHSPKIRLTISGSGAPQQESSGKPRDGSGFEKHGANKGKAAAANTAELRLQGNHGSRSA